jgi:thiamine kinase-like enzyme
MSSASLLGLAANDAAVLHNSNKLTLRLQPCDVLARVAPAAHQVARFEVDVAQRLAEVGSPVAALASPGLADPDRVFLASTLDRMRRAVSESGRPEQLLHGEPHPGNLLLTRTGPLFIDFETCCRGPIEFDLAHAPDEVADQYAGVHHRLLRHCRTLMLAMITAWRWDRDDRFPDGHRLGIEWLNELRKEAAQSA